MGKELNTLNEQIAPMREAMIRGEKSKENPAKKTVPECENVSSVSNNPNRTLFSPESLRDHNVPGYGSQEKIGEEKVGELER